MLSLYPHVLPSYWRRIVDFKISDVKLAFTGIFDTSLECYGGANAPATIARKRGTNKRTLKIRLQWITYIQPKRKTLCKENKLNNIQNM